MKKEIWKAVRNFQNLYEVSNLGRVRSLDRVSTFKVVYPSGKEVQKTRIFKGKLLKPTMDNCGYYHVRLADNNQYTLFKVHKLVWQTFNSKIKRNLTINHKNEIKSDNRLANLELMTRKKNLRTFRKNNNHNYRYRDQNGQCFSSFRSYAKRHKLRYNRYFFLKSLKLNINYMKTDYKFEVVE